jgi:hypothetical protein
MSHAVRREPLEQQLVSTIENQDMDRAEVGFQLEDVPASCLAYSLVMLVNYVDQAGRRGGGHQATQQTTVWRRSPALDSMFFPMKAR